MPSLSLSSTSTEIKKDSTSKKLVIILAGPTAVGKSSIGSILCSPEMATDIMTNHAVQNGIDVTKDISSLGHVVSADSVQVYQGVQVGANKPTTEEMDKTPHHLINIVDGDSICQYNAADWMRDAVFVINNLYNYPEVQSDMFSDDETELNENEDETNKRRNRISNYIQDQFTALKKKNDKERKILPVVVGGTMMYLQWLVHGRPDAMKPTEAAVEKAAATIVQYQEEDVRFDDNGNSPGWDAAIKHTNSLGPIFAERVLKLQGKDWYRLRRILEVAYTVIDDDENKFNIDDLYNGQRQGGLDSMEYDVRCFFLCPNDRMAHTAIVDSRCEDMLLKGLLQETTDLTLAGLLPEQGQQARAIGYRQTLDYLKRSEYKADDTVAFSQYLDNFTTATRRYAKKQMQWFRRDEKFVFVPVQLSKPSKERSEIAAKLIRDLCILPRKDFDKELLHHSIADSGTDINDMPISIRTKLENEKQGKSMKFYIGKRHKLHEKSDDYLKVMKESDECTRNIQNFLCG